MTDNATTTALVAPAAPASTDIATANAGRELAFYGLDREQVALLKRTVAKGATDDQLSLFLVTAKRLGLDPFAKQIYCVLRPVKGGGFEMAIQIAIDGLRAIAARTGEVDGQEGPFWAGEDGIWRDTWTSAIRPEVAKVLVYRKGCSRPFPGIAHLKSYAAYKDDGKTLAQKWAQMPEHMLAKCAEAAALRKAFPYELGGLYAPEEFDHDSVIDVAPGVERLPLAPVLPAAAPVATADPWDEFLAELAPVPLVAGCAESLGVPVDRWTEDEIKRAWASLLTARTIGEVNAAVGPWIVVIGKYTKTCTRVAAMKAHLDTAYKARTAELRAAAQAAPPKNGGQP